MTFLRGLMEQKKPNLHTNEREQATCGVIRICLRDFNLVFHTKIYCLENGDLESLVEMFKVKIQDQKYESVLEVCLDHLQSVKIPSLHIKSIISKATRRLLWFLRILGLPSKVAPNPEFKLPPSRSEVSGLAPLTPPKFDRFVFELKSVGNLVRFPKIVRVGSLL